MAEHIKWFEGRKEEYVALGMQAAAAGFGGRTGDAASLSKRAIDLARRSEANEIAAIFAAEQALRLVFWSSGTGLPKVDPGLADDISDLLADFLDIEFGKEAVSRSCIALALASLTPEARSLVEALHAERPKDTLLNELWLPTIRATLALQASNARSAISELEITERYERAGEFFPQFLRGISYLHLEQPEKAVSEFDKILDNRGEAPLSSIYPLARLGKARALNDTGEYDKFFELWRDADIEIPA